MPDNALWSLFLRFMSGEYTPGLLSILILIVALGTFFYFQTRLRGFRRQMQAFHQALEGFDGTPETLETLEATLSQFPALQKAWQPYSQGLLRPDPFTEPELRVRSPQSARELVTSSLLESHSLRISFVPVPRPSTRSPIGSRRAGAPTSNALKGWTRTWAEPLAPSIRGWKDIQNPSPVLSPSWTRA